MNFAGIALHLNHSLFFLDFSFPPVAPSPALKSRAAGACFTEAAIFHLWPSGEFISFHCSVLVAQTYIQG